jgi:hypothetical protein
VPNKVLVDLLGRIIKQKTTTVNTVANLTGAPPINVPLPTSQAASSTWSIFNLLNFTNNLPYPLSPDQVLDQITTIQISTAPNLTAVNGIINYSVGVGTSMATTIVTLNHATQFSVEVNAPNRLIAIYNNETIVQRGLSGLSATLNFPAGQTSLNIVTQGPASSVQIAIPPDINSSITSIIPPTPSWISSGAINPSYVDPSSQSLGVELFWNNQPSVGGWDIYRVNVNYGFGPIVSSISSKGNYVIQTLYSGTTPYTGAIGIVNSGYIGTLLNHQYNPVDGVMVFTFAAADQGQSVFSGVLGTVSFNQIASIVKNTSDVTISFVDLNVAQGQTYNYTIDSFSLVDPSVKSDKAPVLTATVNPLPVIGSFSLTEATPGYLTLALGNISPQVKYWSGWVRNGNWPTITSGQAPAALDNTYLKFQDEDTQHTTFTFSANTGWWYGEVLPYDSNNNGLIRVIASGYVSGIIGGGTSTNAQVPTITNLTVATQSNGQNMLSWTTNQAGERPDSANGNIYVKVYATNHILNIVNKDITNYFNTVGAGVIRYLWNDVNTSTFFDSASNLVTLGGSMMDPYAQYYSQSNAVWSVYNYRVVVYSGVGNPAIDTLEGSYGCTIFGPFSLSASGGGRLSPQ